MKFALWTLLYFLLLVAALAFGMWLVGKPEPLQDSEHAKRAEAHVYEMERLRALSLMPPRASRGPCRGSFAFASQVMTNVHEECL